MCAAYFYMDLINVIVRDEREQIGLRVFMTGSA